MLDNQVLIKKVSFSKRDSVPASVERTANDWAQSYGVTPSQAQIEVNEKRKRDRRKDTAANRAGMVVETSSGVPQVRLP